LRAELGLVESRNYQEKREIERLELDLRDATQYSQKCFSDIQRLKEAIATRDLDIRGFKLRLEQLETDLENSQRRIAALTEAREQKDQEINGVHVRIGQENLQLNQTKAAL